MLVGKSLPERVEHHRPSRHVQAELNTAGFFFLAHRPPPKKSLRREKGRPEIPCSSRELNSHVVSRSNLRRMRLTEKKELPLPSLSAQRSGTHINQPSTRGAAWQDSPVPAGHLQSPHGHRAEQAGAERAPGLVLSCGCCPGNRSDPRGSAHARLQREFLSPLSCNLQFVRQNQQFLTPMKGHVTFDFTEAFHAHYCNQIKFIPF